MSRVFSEEAQRIIKVYQQREQHAGDRYTLYNPAYLYLTQSIQREVIRELATNKVNITDARILDVGCGDGAFLNWLVHAGAKPENLHGVDLMDNRIARARTSNSALHLDIVDATDLPYRDGSFDVVTQFMLFTSVLAPLVRSKIASELLRVTKGTGFILWYDFFLKRPGNRDVVCLKRKDVAALFPECEVRLRRTSLAPPLARLTAPWSYLVCDMLARLPFLRTHLIGSIRKIV